MPACPSAEQIARYQRVGCLFPVDCLVPDGIRHYRGYLEPFEREQGDVLRGDEYENVDLKPRPARECDPASCAVHAAVVERSCVPNNLLTVRRRSDDAGI